MITLPHFQKLRAVFGDCIPAKNAEAQLAQSALAPSDAVELRALSDVVKAFAGRKLAEVGAEQGLSPSLVALSQVAAAKRTPADGLQRVLSPWQLKQAFDAAKDHPDIPWGFVEEGCLHRSHVLAHTLEEQGLWCEKVFTIPQGGDLIMQAPGSELGFTVCWYHEAVVVHVQTDRHIERRVIDPSMADEPLTVEAWLALMKSNTGTALETFFLPRFAYGLSDRDDPPTAWVPDQLATARSWKDEWRAVKQSLVDMDFYTELKRLAQPRP